MEILRKLRWVLYPCAFYLVFLFGAYCTFPTTVLREMAESSLTHTALRVGPKNRGLVQVTMKDISLWRFSGINVTDLKLHWPGNKTHSAMTVDFNSFQSRLGLLALLAGNQDVHAQGSLYDGSFSIDAKTTKKTLTSIYFDASKINLAKMVFLESLVGSAMGGLINMNIDLSAATGLSKDGTGPIKLNFENLSFGPGNINLPAGGFVSAVTVPKIALGKLLAELNLEKGVLTSKNIALSGGDVEAELKLTMTLGPRPDLSRLDGHGWFSLKPELINSNETLKMLYDLIPELKSAPQNHGRVGLLVNGSLVRPNFRLEQYQAE